MAIEQDSTKCQWRGCEAPATPGRKLCEKHASDNPRRFKPKGKPNVEIATALLASDSKSKRKQGMEMLCELHTDDQILSHALKESDSSILDIASEALSHHPFELVRHLLTQPSAHSAGLYMRYHLARDNRLYAEETIHEVFSSRKSLTLPVIEGIGRAYLRSLADLLQKYTTASLELYDDALQSKGPKAVAGVEGLDTAGWSRDGWGAIRSAVAIARLDVNCNLNDVERLLQEAERVQNELPKRDFWAAGVRERIGRTILGTRAYLEWILFDRGVRNSVETIGELVREGAIEVLPDLATTMVKRQQNGLLGDLARQYPLVFFVESDFCFWPLMNWLEANGLLAKNEFGLVDGNKKGSLWQYWRAREQGIEPPPWWKWR